MIILALDTTSDLASVAIRRDDVTLVEETVSTSDGHSQVLFQMIESALKKTGLTLEQVDVFASANGPGSFTGVRICLSAAKGLGDATGKPVAAISNLRALATFGTAPLRNPILDARRGQIYSAVYASNLALVSPETLTSAAECPELPGVERIAITPPLAAAIALCAALDGPAIWRDPAQVDASYIRRSDAEMYWTDAKSS